MLGRVEIYRSELEKGHLERVNSALGPVVGQPALTCIKHRGKFFWFYHFYDFSSRKKKIVEFLTTLDLMF